MLMRQINQDPVRQDLKAAGVLSAAGVFGLYFRDRPEWRSLWRYSIATSVVSVGFMAALVVSLESRHLIGLWQRLVVVTLFAWTTIMGIRLHNVLGREGQAR